MIRIYSGPGKDQLKAYLPISCMVGKRQIIRKSFEHYPAIVVPENFLCPFLFRTILGRESHYKVLSGFISSPYCFRQGQDKSVTVLISPVPAYEAVSYSFQVNVHEIRSVCQSVIRSCGTLKQVKVDPEIKSPWDQLVQ